ncbi:hypothetical protein PLICRDRAFT_180404 [Plicaturopsis crispa FD-325 SS-3]|uniref:Uncharacterized protein n=1 Tax=Plicaturopsis crispa FD-325 SS-3 TaxID=944288 RepID=A0A0C9SW50_PLICR|nr:hypothetical protein PLICRDRAFT_180404 [Plicaturopsis crispa FD-325 SS-3]
MLVFLSSSSFPSPASLRTATLATPRITARGGYRLFFISTTSPTLLIPTTPRDVATLRTPHTHGTPYPLQLNGHHHHHLVFRVSHAHPPPPHHFPVPPPPPALSTSLRARWTFRIHSGLLLRLHTASYLSVPRTVPSAEGECDGVRGGEDPGTTDADDAVEQAVGAAADTPYTPEAQHGADVPARAVCAVHACAVRIPVPARTVHAFAVPFCAARAVRIVPVRAVRVASIRAGSADPIPVCTVRAPLSSQPLSPSSQCTPLLSRFALSAHC